tara:strand:- start:67 stop:381 length:315 start_codon:yes stop_codon:yes gene_type:complete
MPAALVERIPIIEEAVSEGTDPEDNVSNPDLLAILPPTLLETAGAKLKRFGGSILNADNPDFPGPYSPCAAASVLDIKKPCSYEMIGVLSCVAILIFIVMRYYF